MHDCELDPARTPEAIEARSFAIIEALIPKPRPFTGDAWRVARRCIHTSGDPSILRDLVLPEAGILAGISAIREGAPLIVDTTMVEMGISRRFFSTPPSLTALLALPGLAEAAKRGRETRASAAVRMWADNIGGSLVVIGNAPTALLTLLELLDRGLSPPRLIIGMPVGFVNAAQAKYVLAHSAYPHLTLLGTRGGSPLAAACVNALASIVQEDRFLPTRAGGRA